MFRRRRKPRVQWLPNDVGNVEFGDGRSTGSATDDAPVIEHLEISDFTLPRITQFPLFLDADPEEAQAGAPAATISKQGLTFNQKWGYRLRRIVGKFLLVAGPNTGAQNGYAGLHIKLGIMVRRIDPETGVALAQASLADPLAFGNVTDPWIWQRNFFLSTGLQPNPTGTVETTLGAALPASTFDIGGTKDGPVFDIKTARRIGPEERTFLVVSAVGIPQGDAASLVPADSVFYFLRMDYRALASIHRVDGNRRNSTR